MNPIQHKKALRHQALQYRDHLSWAERDAKSRIICAGMQELVRHLRGSSLDFTVLAYMPFRTEVDIIPFIEWCLRNGIRVAIPRTVPAERMMIPYYMTSFDDTVLGNYGIREPRAELSAVCDHTAINLLVIPGVAFDEYGFRLGYGGGYYDRFIEQLEFGKNDDKAGSSNHSLPWLVAPAYERQIVEQVAAEPHDRQMDIIITEERSIDLRGVRRDSE